MDEQPAQPKLNLRHMAPDQAQHDSRQSYLETVLSCPPQPAGPKALPYEPYPVYRRLAHRPLSAALGINNFTNDTLVPPPLPEAAVSANMPSFHDFPAGAFCIDCNSCGESIPNEHYHCSICDNGDFDLCQVCVDHGVSCDGQEHWLIKRSIRGGLVIPSVTQTIAPKGVTKPSDKAAVVQEMKQSLPVHEDENDTIAERTCNSCIRGILIFKAGKLIDG